MNDTKIPPRGSRERLLEWNEWFQTGIGVAIFFTLCSFIWLVLLGMGYAFLGSAGVMLGHIFGIFIGVPAAGVVMDHLWKPTKAKAEL